VSADYVQRIERAGILEGSTSPVLAIQRENLTSTAGAALIAALNAELSGRYPEVDANHFRLDGEEVVEDRGAFLVAYSANRPIGCGAIRLLDEGMAEIKRMYVVPQARGTGTAYMLLDALQAETRRLGATRIVLETGRRQPEALSLYLRAGFVRVPQYGEYLGSPLSVCMARLLHPARTAPTLGTARLVLSTLTPDDAEPLFAYRSDPEVQRYQYFEPKSVDDALAFIAAEDDDLPEWHQLGIRLRESAELIGDVGFKLSPNDSGRAELGVTLAPAFQRHGFATEAVTALVGHLSGDRDVRQVFVSIDPRNTASSDLFKRLGFRMEALLRGSLWFKGEWVDDAIYAKSCPPARLIGICGDDCAACPRFIATQTEDPREFEKVRDLWVRLGLRPPDFPAEKLACRGCSPANDCAYPEMQACAHAKSLAHCGRCAEYPCPLIAAAFERSDQFRARVEEICEPAEAAAIIRAFLSKKQNLEALEDA
jgi:putative acetyltransferase